VIRILILTPELRKELKAPLGLLVTGSFEETSRKIAELVNKKKPQRLIAVGDRVSRNLIKSKIPLDVAIIDLKVMRRPISPIRFETENTFRASNPAGTLSEEAWIAVEKAVNSPGRSKVIIEGEEDLLTLVAVLSAPNGSMVVYGQPKQGIVVLDVDEETKRRIRGIIERMGKKSIGDPKNNINKEDSSFQSIKRQ